MRPISLESPPKFERRSISRPLCTFRSRNRLIPEAYTVAIFTGVVQCVVKQADSYEFPGDVPSAANYTLIRLRSSRRDRTL